MAVDPIEPGSCDADEDDDDDDDGAAAGDGMVAVIALGGSDDSHLHSLCGQLFWVAVVVATLHP